MAARKLKKREDDAGGPGEWIVTFSDCMTLLLCFFVLMLTFSSFDEVELQKLAGVFNCDSNPSIFPVPREIKDSSVAPVERLVDLTDRGSETPTDSKNLTVENPGHLAVVVDDDAYRDRKVFYIPSHWLFWGQGTRLTRDGCDHLRAVASFLRVLPCRIVIGETGPGGAEREDVQVDRALAVMQFLTSQGEVKTERFSITASAAPIPARLRGYRVVSIALISRKVY